MISRSSHLAHSSRERLAQISHHFLSDDMPPVTLTATQTNTGSHAITGNDRGNPAQPYILPVLMNPLLEFHFPVYALSQALLGYKTSSAVILVEGETQSSTSSTVFTPHEHTGQAIDQCLITELLQQGRQHGPDICLIPVAAINSPCVIASRRVLIPVQATLNGIRYAYLQLKRLASVGQNIDTGVFIVDCEDPAWARRCFDKLAAGAITFLDQTITSYGYLPDRIYPDKVHNLPLDYLQNIPSEIVETADMILADLEQYRQIGMEQVKEGTPESSPGYP